MTGDARPVSAVLEELRARVRAQSSHAGPTAGQDRLASEVQLAIQAANANARVNSHLPLLWEDMFVGRLRAIVQRVVRRLLRWYINPIVDQQNVFNAASAQALTLLAADNNRLRRELTELSARLDELEKRLPHG